MKMAIEEVRKRGKMKTAARLHKVPRTTLYRHLSGQLSKPSGSCHLGPKSILGDDNENMLLDHILEFEKRGFPLTVTDIRKLAYEFADKNGIQNNFSKTSQMPGLDWWSVDFRKDFMVN